MKRLLAILGAVTAMVVSASLPAQAQGGGGGGGRGNFSPEEMRQRMMDRYKEMMGVKSDDEWKAIETRVQKVMDARREVGGMGGGMRGMFGPRRGGGDTQAEGSDRRRQFGPAPSPAAEDLQKAIESGASSDTIKTKLEAYREDRKQKQAAVVKAQEDLKKILTLKQEAAAVLAGLLD